MAIIPHRGVEGRSLRYVHPSTQTVRRRLGLGVMICMVDYPPSVNSMYRTFRGRMLISKKGRVWMAQAVKDIKMQSHGWFVTGPTALSIEAWMPDNRRRDIDNLLKPLLDSLTHAGVWKDDCQVHDLRITRRGINKEKPSCVMHVEAL